MSMGNGSTSAGKSSAVVGMRIVEQAQKRPDFNTFTPMKVLKLAYIAHGWMLVLHGRPLIRDSIEAWRWGPLMPELYDRIRQQAEPDAVSMDCFEDVRDNLDDDEKGMIDGVIEVYGKHNASTLVKMTHQKGSPWWDTYRNGRGESDDIADSIIKAYYSNVLNEAKHGQERHASPAV